MTEIFSVVPEVAVREGKGREDWAAIARQAGAFGTALAMDGTAVQALIRDYLKDEEKTFIRVSPKGLGDNPAFLASAWDARKLKLDDETGITTVTPYDDLRLAAIDIVEKHLVGENAHACVALQAPSPAAGCRNMFTAVWSAYGSAVERLIYSQADESAVQVTAQDEKDQYYEQHLLEILYDQMDRLSQMV